MVSSYRCFKNHFKRYYTRRLTILIVLCSIFSFFDLGEGGLFQTQTLNWDIEVPRLTITWNQVKSQSPLNKIIPCLPQPVQPQFSITPATNKEEKHNQSPLFYSMAQGIHPTDQKSLGGMGKILETPPQFSTKQLRSVVLVIIEHLMNTQ